jgi:GH25 family lysozyme M1 (1,4-beta-N-acetylmuramidase)
MIRGAYHFALPNSSSGATQADYFVNHGGGWSRDGKTLPGVLDIEYNPYGATCYGLSQSSMRSWIASFLNRYKYRTGRDAVIYTTTNWWTTCTGNTSQFSATNPLWIARYASTAGTLPSGWGYYTFWQYTDSPIDQDYFNGDLTRVKALALG